MRNFVAIFFGLFVTLVHQAVAQDSLDFNQKVEVRKVLNNSSEKASFTAYKPYSTRTLSSLSQFKSNKIRTDKYGGRMDSKEKATGFYYTKKIGNRWWVIDPQGYLFIHNAVNAVSIGASDRNKEAFSKLYSDENDWMGKTQAFQIHG